MNEVSSDSKDIPEQKRYSTALPRYGLTKLLFPTQRLEYFSFVFLTVFPSNDLP